MNRTATIVTQDHITEFQRNGATMIKGLFADGIDRLRAGVEKNMATPGPYAAENVSEGGAGRFFDDYCNWSRIPEFADVIQQPNVGMAAALLMGSQRVQLFHDHVLVKEAATAKPTPWHQDSPYYFVEGQQTLSFWVPLDPVSDATLRCVVGSHLWEKPVLPTEWAMQPGDAVAFDFRTLHGARGNDSGRRRRAFSLRVVGDDARYVERPGPTSPPFPGHGMQAGDQLREDWFPIIYTAPSRQLG